VISLSVESALGAYAPTVIRLAGGDRYATAVEVSEYGFQDAGSADTVIVVTGQGFADALAGGPAAIAFNGPVLLTNPTSLPAVVAAEITRLAPERIIVIGGAAAVSDAVFDQLEPLAAEVVRIAGASRYQTAIAVSVEAFASASRVYIATGLNFPDALAGGAAAGWWGGPMLLVPGTSLPEEVGNEIVRLGATKVIILGGTGGVSQGVEDALNALIAS
jgi:putative cell wall-binding protein